MDAAPVDVSGDVLQKFVRGTARDLAARYAAERPKGEVTVVIAAADADARGEHAGESDA